MELLYLKSVSFISTTSICFASSSPISSTTSITKPFLTHHILLLLVNHSLLVKLSFEEGFRVTKGAHGGCTSVSPSFDI